MNTVPIKIAWDKTPDADRYVVYVQTEGSAWQEIETQENTIVLALPERTPILIHVTSRNGDLESIPSEEMRIFVRRW